MLFCTQLRPTYDEEEEEEEKFKEQLQQWKKAEDGVFCTFILKNTSWRIFERVNI